MLADALKRKAQAALCRLICRENTNLKMGTVDTQLRRFIVELSIADEFSDTWCENQLYAYECWLREHGLL